MEKQQLQIQINKVPAESKLAKRIAPFGPKDVKKYRLYGSYNPTTKKHTLRDVYIPNRDIVIDPDTGDSYDIGFVNNIGEGGVPVFGDIWFQANGLCQFLLHGNRAKDQKIYKYIEMSNFLAQNEYRDNSQPLLIERVDETTDSDVVRNIRKNKRKAFDMIDAMSDQEITSILRQNVLPVSATENGRKETLEEIVDAGNIEIILRSSTAGADKTNELLDLVKAAQKNEKIAYDKTTNSWTASDTTLLFVVKKGVGVSQVGELVKFLESPEGKDSLDKIKSL